MQWNPVGVGVGLLVLLALFRLLEWLRPASQRLPLLRRGFWTDVAYFFFSPLVSRTLTAVAVAIALVPLALAIYGKVDRNLILHGYGPASRLPAWAQVLAILGITEVAGYWMHRAFHAVPWLWRFHAIHHSSVDLDWLSATRLHPGNDAVMKIVAAAPVVALGFSPAAIGATMPLLTLLAIGVHAHLDWDFGPLRAVIVSPRFHRWHHSDAASARDRNFAGLLPVLDILFGTWYMPRDARPTSFGVDLPVPEGLPAQLVFPFRRADR